jgi:hypothetical protein
MRMSVTIEANRSALQRVEANLYKVVYVRSVPDERATKEALDLSLDDCEPALSVMTSSAIPR